MSERRDSHLDDEVSPHGSETAASPGPTSPGEALLEKVRRRPISWGLGLGLATAVVISLVQPVETPPPSIHWLPPLGEEIRARALDEDTWDEDLAVGFEAYEAREVRRAVDALRGTETRETLDLYRRVYLGSALVALGEHEEAISVLSDLPWSTLPTPWSSEGRWSLYLALAGSGRSEEARSLLQTLASEPGAVGDRARAVLPEAR